MKFNLIIVLFTIVVTALLSPVMGKAAGDDSIKNQQLVANVNAAEGRTIFKKANVRYPELLENQQAHFVAYVEKFAINRRAYLMRMHNKGKHFFPKTTRILQQYKVPTEFKVLMALESAFNANSISSAGAVGYWQLMDDVAKEYGLTIVPNTKKGLISKTALKQKDLKNKVVVKKQTDIPTDDRKHFLKSTHTAARYLRDRMRNLQNNWLLVAASYNWGVGNVWKALDRSGKKNPTFWDIKDQLPTETQAYVMNFIALNVIFLNYDQFVNNQLCFKDEGLQPDKRSVVYDVAKGN